MKSAVMKVATERPATHSASLVRTPERQALAAAISHRDGTALALTAAQRAVERARSAMNTAEEGIEAARAAVAEAGERHVDDLADALAGDGTVSANAGTRRALTLVEDAQRALELTTQAHAKLKARLGDAEDQHLDAEHRVTAHVDIVLRTPAEPMLAEAEDAASRLASLLPLMQFFIMPQVTPENALGPWSKREPFYTDWKYEAHTMGKDRATRRSSAASAASGVRDAPFKELSSAIQKFLERPLHLENEWYRHPGLEAWHAAREALHHDPDAPMPSLSTT